METLIAGSHGAHVSAQDLQLRFPAKRRMVEVLRGVSFEIAEGDRVALSGSSGAGKSSLLYCIGGMLLPSSGGVVVDGRLVASLDERARAEFRLRRIGMVFQSFQLLPALSALANVALPMRLAGVSRKEAKTRAEGLLDAVGLADRAQHKPHELSGGEQQRVAVARAVANDPGLILADEPTGNLDDDSAELVLDLLLAPANKRTCLLATHDPRVARRLGRVVHLAKGRTTEEDLAGIGERQT